MLAFPVVRCALIQAGHGGHHGEREGLSQAHQDLGAVWHLHEDPQFPQEVSLHELHLCSKCLHQTMKVFSSAGGMYL